MRRVVMVFAVGLLLAGCGSGSAEPDLAGKTFTSSSVTGHDLVEGSQVRVSFEDGNLAVQAGCNTMTGAYEVDGGTLRWTGNAASTLMGCPDDLMAQDAWLMELFTGGVEADLDGDTLTLTSGDVTMELTES